MKVGPRPGELLVDPQSQEVLGLSLSADMTWEHEWGIDGIRLAFGSIDISQPATRVPNSLDFFQTDKAHYLIFNPNVSLGWPNDQAVARWVDWQLEFRDRSAIDGCWDADHFVLRSYPAMLPEAPQLLPELYLAMIDGDVLFTQQEIGPKGPFSSPCLSFLFRSRLLALQP